VSDTPLPPKRPYLLRAMHQWMTDGGQTPHVIVDVDRHAVEVPRAFVKDGKIVLNISYDATQYPLCRRRASRPGTDRRRPRHLRAGDR
jgi:stringent starvation protein B